MKDNSHTMTALGCRGLTQKIYLQLTAPSETDNRSDEERLLTALGERIGEKTGTVSPSVHLTLPALQQLSALCAAGIYELTASLTVSTGGSISCVKVEAGDTTDRHYGYAVDLGSTGVVVSLVSLSEERVLGTVNMPNRQIRYGEDILTRIFYSKDSPEKLRELQQAAVSSITEAFAELKELTGIGPEECLDAVIAGNTCMTHFLLGLDAFCLFSSPYAPHGDRGGFYPAKDLGLPLAGLVYVYPCFANYIGGDTISGMISIDMYRRKDLSVFFDVGTNGELVVGCREFLLCGAGAAGPALEGGSVSTGMRASRGAVQGVRMNDDVFELDIIGDEKGNVSEPVGICGSGIVDLISELFLHGWLSLTGKLCPENIPQITLRSLPETDKQQYAVEYAPGLWFYQQDIDEFLRTKAAAWTMMDYMLSQAGIGAGDISCFYMCGAFGTHMQVESAVNIGMYPDVDREKIIPAGNTSLDGCVKMLLDASALEDIREIKSMMTYIQFGVVEDFVERMHAAMALPHTNIELFPTVMKRLQKK